MKRSLNIIILLLAIIAGTLLYNNCTNKANPSTKTPLQNEKSGGSTSANKIDELTNEGIVVPYIKKHKKLPDYYITKKEARDKGWIAAEGNLCDVLPGKAIGGDVFTNREGNLPDKNNRTWYEADLNYKCGRRNADRVLFSNDGLIFVTHDHYKTFDQK